MMDTLANVSVESQTHRSIPRAEIVKSLFERDGNICQYPGCEKELDSDIPESRWMVTIDHYIPQHFGRANGWTYEQIWDLSNLRLMHKACNAKKGDRVPNPDGTLPERSEKTFRYRRDKRATRPELCEACDNGHNLFFGEVCASCGCDAQRFPRWAKMKANECSHDITWCWACSIGIVERAGALEMLILHGEGGE